MFLFLYLLFRETITLSLFVVLLTSVEGPAGFISPSMDVNNPTIFCRQSVTNLITKVMLSSLTG